MEPIQIVTPWYQDKALYVKLMAPAVALLVGYLNARLGLGLDPAAVAVTVGGVMASAVTYIYMHKKKTAQLTAIAMSTQNWRAMQPAQQGLVATPAPKTAGFARVGLLGTLALAALAPGLVTSCAHGQLTPLARSEINCLEHGVVNALPVIVPKVTAALSGSDASWASSLDGLVSAEGPVAVCAIGSVIADLESKVSAGPVLSNALGASIAVPAYSGPGPVPYVLLCRALSYQQGQGFRHGSVAVPVPSPGHPSEGL